MNAARPIAASCAAVAAAALVACHSNGGPTMSELKITSTAFRHMGEIPSRFTCEGADISPPLSWTAGPDGTRSYVLIMDDPDAPAGTWDHWLIYRVEATVLPEATSAKDKPSQAVREGVNSWGKACYGGPCPPPPTGRHRYFFKVYALDTTLAFTGPPRKKELLTAMQGHILATGELMGTYDRSK